MVQRAMFRCENCLLHQDDAGFPHEVDHIISRQHGGETITDNLAYACMVCNRYKGSNIASVAPSGDLAPLFNPRLDRWNDHFRLNGAAIEPLGLVGEVKLWLKLAFPCARFPRLLPSTIYRRSGRILLSATQTTTGESSPSRGDPNMT